MNNKFLNKILCCFLMLVSARSGYAQPVKFEWAKGFGQDRCESYSVKVDKKGDVYIAGLYQGTTDFDPGSGTDMHASSQIDAFVSKFSSTGTLKWAKTFTGISTDMAFDVAIDETGNVYTVGSFSSRADFNPGTGVADTFFLESFGNGNGGSPAFISKLDSAGNFVWAKSWGSEVYGQFTQAKSIAVSKEGDIYITGIFKGTVDFNPGSGISLLTASLDAEGFVLKLTASGDFAWAKKLGNGPGPGDYYGGSYPERIVVGASGNIYYTGSFLDSIDFDPGPNEFLLVSEGGYMRDAFVAKLTADGNFVWAKKMGAENEDDFGCGIALDGSENVLLTGSFTGAANFNMDGGGFILTSSGNGAQQDIFVSKVDSAGKFIWAKQFKGSSRNHLATGYGVVADLYGNVYTTGYFTDTLNFGSGTSDQSLTAKSRSNSDVFVSKLNAQGDYIWAKNFSGTLSSSDEFGRGIALDAAANIYITGNFEGTMYPDPGNNKISVSSHGSATSDAFLHKFSQECIKTYDTISITVCDSFGIGGTYYSKSGTYTAIIPNAINCDSIITLHLTVKGNRNSVSAQACDQFVYNGKTYFTSGTYTHVFRNEAGCDSTVTLNVTINGSNQDTLIETSCGSYRFNDSVYYESGIYTQLFQNAQGCDSSFTIDLRIRKADTVVKQEGMLLIANAIGASYQWLNCTDHQAIPGATSRSFNPVNPGSYAVAVTQEGCTDTSSCYTFTGTGIYSTKTEHWLQVYPNPGDNWVTLTTGINCKNARLRLVNLLGQVVLEQLNLKGNTFTLDLSTFAHGAYFIEIQEKDQVNRIKIVKQ